MPIQKLSAGNNGWMKKETKISIRISVVSRILHWLDSNWQWSPWEIYCIMTDYKWDKGNVSNWNFLIGLQNITHQIFVNFSFEKFLCESNFVCQFIKYRFPIGGKTCLISYTQVRFLYTTQFTLTYQTCGYYL